MHGLFSVKEKDWTAYICILIQSIIDYHIGQYGILSLVMATSVLIYGRRYKILLSIDGVPLNADSISVVSHQPM